jgi:hypothetical protein
MKKLAILLLFISINLFLFSMGESDPLNACESVIPKSIDAKIKKTSFEVILDIVKQKPFETLGGIISFTGGLCWFMTKFMTKLFDSKKSDSESEPWEKNLRDLQLSLTAEQWVKHHTEDILIEAYSGNLNVFLENKIFWQDLGPVQKRLVLKAIALKPKSL